MRIRTQLKAADRNTISMRHLPRTTSRKEHRLELLVIRAGLRAGARRRDRG